MILIKKVNLQAKIYHHLKMDCANVIKKSGSAVIWFAYIPTWLASSMFKNFSYINKVKLKTNLTFNNNNLCKEFIFNIYDKIVKILFQNL